MTVLHNNNTIGNAQIVLLCDYNTESCNPIIAESAINCSISTEKPTLQWSIEYPNSNNSCYINFPKISSESRCPCRYTFNRADRCPACSAQLINRTSSYIESELHLDNIQDGTIVTCQRANSNITPPKRCTLYNCKRKEVE